ncbi:hypothetical protein QCA50_009965 [Cerrena zonata]|uniref:Major facilitator superfamily (MFS) profile domain-containing protein n=1 Tax=Cerrena zonata TaxID=2478898 RepID=A0AAW0G9L0_9APHY
MLEDEKNQPIAKVGSTSSVSSSEEAKKHFIYDEELRKSRFNKKPNLTDILTIFCAGFALISDGYQNNVMTMLNPTFTKLYPKTYDADLKAAVSNASTVGTILGQVAIGFATDLISRKTAIVIATLFLILGTILCAAAHGKTDYGMFWMLIIARGVTGFGIGAEYPSSSVSANEAANESHKRRGFPFVMCTNFPLSFGGPLALCIFLIVYQITKVHDGLWRAMGTAYGISAAIGKVGAVVGTKVFTPIEDNLGQGWTFIIAAICGLVGVLVGWFFIPQLKDDDLMQEDIKFKNYLLDHGWTGHFGTDEVVDLEKERAIDDDLVNDSDVEQKKEQLEYQKQFIH